MDGRQRRANPAPEPDPGLTQAVDLFLPGASLTEQVPGHAHLVRVEHDGAWWKVRRWPEATPRGRVDFVHRVLEQAAGEADGLAPRPRATSDGAHSIVVQGALYDCQSWLPGEAVADGPEAEVRDGRLAPLPVVVPDELVVDILRRVATAHERTAALAAGQRLAAPPLSQLLAAVTQSWQEQRGVLRPIAVATPAVRRWLAIGERALPAAETAITGALTEEASQTLCHFGLWPAHVIVPESSESAAGLGLIGWEHCNIGSALIDIAQVVSRFRGWSAAGAELAIAAYSEAATLRPEDRRLLPAVAALDLIVTSGQMLIDAYGGRPSGTRARTPLREAARSLLDSLDAASSALTAQERPKRAAHRVWRPGGPPPSSRSEQPRRRRPGPQKKR